MNRPLTEELHSVLREHALDAPAPQASIDAVFRRVGLIPELATPTPTAVAAAADTGSEVTASAAPRNRGTDGDTAGVALRRWAPRRVLMAAGGAAAAAVLLAAGVAGVIRLNGAGSQRSASSSGMAASAPAASRASGLVPGSDRTLTSPGAEGGAPNDAVRDGLARLAGCPGTEVRISSLAVVAGISAAAVACPGADGLAGPGTLVLYRAGGATGITVIRVLITPSRSLRLASLAVTERRVTVRAVDVAPGPDRGSVSDYRFSLAPDGSVTAQSRTLVAPGAPLPS